METNNCLEKKICFCIGCIDNCGGTERVTSILTSKLIKNTNCNISVLSYEKGEGDIFFDFDKDVKIDYLFDSRISFRKNYGLIIKKLKQYFLEEKYDVIVAVDVSQMIFLEKAIDKSVSKLIVWEQFNYLRSKSGIVANISRRMACKHADVIVTLTDSDANEYKKHIKNNKVCRIYNYLTPQCVEEKKLNRDNTNITLLSVGRLTEQKGFDILIDVAYFLKKDNKKFTWNIVGEGEQRKKIEKKIHKKGVQDCVHLVGKQKDVAQFYRSSDIFVFTSRYEGFGLVIIEAQSFGLPVVSFDCKMGPSELIAENDNGYLVPCFDKHEMARKICKLIDDELLRKSFSEKSKMLFENYSADFITEQWIKLLTEI